MVTSRLTPADQLIIEPLLALAGCSKLQRILILGGRAAEMMFELHRRGYARAATTRRCGQPAAQYDLAFVDWRQRSIRSLDATLSWLRAFLRDAGLMVVWIDPQEPAVNRRLNSILERNGLVVEAGTVLEHGSAVSARICGTKRRTVG